MVANVFERLFTADDAGNLVPLLCERWETLDEGRALLVTLRPNVRFSDGHTMTAEDVKCSFERAIRLDRAAPRAAFSTIRGVAEAGVAADAISGIVVRSEREIEFRLTERLPIYPAILSDLGTGIVRAVRDADGAETVLGTGPFRVASASPDRVVLARNAEYWGGASPALDRVEFLTSLGPIQAAESFRAGGIDIAHELLPDDLERLLRDVRLRPGLAEAPRKNSCFVAFNASSPALAGADVRRALAAVVRTQDLVWQSLGRFALPASGIIPPAMLGHDPGRRRAPVSLAVERSVVAERAGGEAMRLRAAVSPGVMNRYGALVESLFELWRTLDVDVTVETSDIEQYLAAMNSSEGFDLIVCRWSADYDDPDNFTHGLFDSRTGLLREYFHSPETDQIAEEARAEHRPAIRETLYRKFENALLEAGVVVPLFHEVNHRLVSRAVRGLRARSGAPYVNYAEIGKAEPTAASRPAPRRAGGGVVYAPGGTSGVETLDPARVSSLALGEVVPNVFETLTRVIEGAHVVPWLAAEFRAEEGGRRFRFRLRDDVRFHDGRRLTARDVRYSFERYLQDPACAYPGLLAPIRGARAVIAREAGDLEGFRIHSTLEFTIELESPLKLFAVMLTNPATAIVPEGSAFEPGARTRYVGTGPFRVTAFEPGTRLELERNPDYWREGLPKSEGLVFTFGLTSEQVIAEFRAGRLSLATRLAPSDVDALRHDASYAPGYREMTRLASALIAFNTRRGPLADPELRRRIIQAIDTRAIVRRVLGRSSMPAHGLFPPGLPGHEPSRQGSGHLVSLPSPVPFEETIELTGVTTVAYTGRYRELTSELLDAFRRVGLRLRLTTATTAELAELQRACAVDLAWSTWVAAYPDSDTFASLLRTEDGVLGEMCGSPELDRLIERGRTEAEPGARHFIYRQIEDIVARDGLLLPLFHPHNYYFARPEVEGLALTSYTYPSVSYENLWIK